MMKSNCRRMGTTSQRWSYQALFSGNHCTRTQSIYSWRKE